MLKGRRRGRKRDVQFNFFFKVGKSLYGKCTEYVLSVKAMFFYKTLYETHTVMRQLFKLFPRKVVSNSKFL